MALSLVELLTVEPAEGVDVFVGHSESYGVIGVYGGHLVGQALAAGLATVEEPKFAQSFHSYFLRPADGEVPLQYQVTRLREGRGSDVRQIIASQHGHAVFQMTVSFKLAEESDEHQPVMPPVEAPEALAKKQSASFTPPPSKHGRTEMVFASEHFVQPSFTPGREPKLRLWTRCAADSITPRQAQVALAFLSDGTLMFNSVIPHGLPFQTHRLTSIDHAGWFHRPCDVTDWMLFDQHSTTVADGRGMNHGHLFDRAGNLVMTTAQESMLRRIPAKA